MPTVIIVTPEELSPFTHPALDLTTGEIIELEAEPAPVQLELPLTTARCGRMAQIVVAGIDTGLDRR